jgi:predicted metal-dependent hydrolase
LVKDFTKNDYFSASLSRKADLEHLITNTDSIILSIYCAGIAIECMFRAYITKYTKEFDSKHNLEKLYNKSLLASYADTNQKKRLSIAVKKASSIWSNDLRYVSEKRMKRKIGMCQVKLDTFRVSFFHSF